MSNDQRKRLQAPASVNQGVAITTRTIERGGQGDCGKLCVCVYYYRTYYKAVRGGGRRRVEDMCYDRRRAEACVDESAHHALAMGPVRNPVL